MYNYILINAMVHFLHNHVQKHQPTVQLHYFIHQRKKKTEIASIKHDLQLKTK